MQLVRNSTPAKGSSAVVLPPLHRSEEGVASWCSARFVTGFGEINTQWLGISSLESFEYGFEILGV